jgi:hypothetical protein
MQMVDMPAAELEAELAKLERMKLTELRTYWLARWGYAPRLRSVTLLRHLVAWRLQVEPMAVSIKGRGLCCARTDRSGDRRHRRAQY